MRKIFTTLLLCVLLSLSAQNQAPEATATSGTLTVTATVSYSSPYYYAVWIKNSSGTYVRTLMMYGQTSKYYGDLAHWYAESAADKTNATTGATKSSTSAFSATWNGKDKTNTTIVADDNYTVGIEMSSEALGTFSSYVSGVITKGTASQTLTPTAVSPISNITIKWVPTGTGLNDIKLATLYTIYPSPTKSTIYVSGPEFKTVTIYTLSGKQVLKSIEPKINLSALPSGTYLAEIQTSRGTVTKKVVKL